MSEAPRIKLDPRNAFKPDPGCKVCHGRGNVWDGMRPQRCICTSVHIEPMWCKHCDHTVWNVPGTDKWIHVESGNTGCYLKATPLTCGCDRGYTCRMHRHLADLNGTHVSTW